MQTNPETVQLTVTPEQRDHILAALRLWQCVAYAGRDIQDIALNGREFLLSNDNIDALCEEINCG